MYNPLLPDLTSVSDIDLDENISNLSKKLRAAYQLNNGALIFQIQSVLENYKIEQLRRQHEASEKLQEAYNKDVKKLINIS